MRFRGGDCSNTYVNVNGKLTSTSALEPDASYFLGLPEHAAREDTPEIWKWTLPAVRGCNVEARIHELSRQSGSRWSPTRIDIIARKANFPYRSGESE